MTEFQSAHILGYTSTTWWKQALIWLFYVCVWTPIRKTCVKGWRRATKERPQGFLARNMFAGAVRHSLIQAGTNWGKSSLAKEAIADQMDACLRGDQSMFIMDGTQLIDEVLAKVDPTDQQIRERIILIDIEQAGGPGDIGCLPRLNLLNTNAGSDDSYIALTARSAIFEMAFGGLLEGNENTGPMAAMLSFASKTLARVKNPSPDDFIELLRDPHAYLEGLEGIPKMVEDYWRDECKPGKPNMTAQALARRAYQMISNDVVHRLLCNPIETVNLAQRLNEGAIVLVATRSGAATSTGARHIGRFMLSMLLRAAKGRNYLGDIKDTACYVDEFPNFLVAGRDASLLELLSEGRKMGFSINLLNQEEQQLSPAMVSSLLANCETLIAGGVSPAFAQRISFPMGIKKIESGPDKGKPNIDLPCLKPKIFAACVKGRDPVTITSKKDALGDKYRRLPKGRAGRKAVSEVMGRCHRIMREMYAEDPVASMIAEASNVIPLGEIKEARPI